MTDLTVFVAYRGDRLKEEAKSIVGSDSVGDLARLNQRIEQGNGIFKAWAESHGGRVIAALGDGGRLAIGADHLDELRQTCAKYQQEVGVPVSVGVGAKLSDSELALEYAILTGGNAIELFRKELPQEIEELKDPKNAPKLMESFLDKAEPAPTPLNSKAAGGGMTAPAQGGDQPPEEEPEPEDAPQMDVPQQQAPDLAGQFGQLAQESEGREQQAQQQQQAEQQQAQDSENMRGEIVKILKQFQSMGPLWEQLKQAEPKAYKSLADMMKVMIELARQVYGAGDEQQQEQPVQKSESPLHSTVDGFMAQLKSLPKDGPHRGKFITQHMNHGPFLSALSAHPQGQQIKGMLNQFMNSKANAGPRVASTVVAKKDLMPGGKGDDAPDSDFDDDQLEVGVRTERKEHGLDPQRAKEIAKDHLTEDPRYYTKTAIPESGPSGTVQSFDGVKPKHHKAKKPGSTGRFQATRPVSIDTDPGPATNRTGGTLKIATAEGKTKTRSVRAGQVKSFEDGTAQSSLRNPSEK